MSEERVQKILARAGIASRRKAEELIREGVVTINGRVAEVGDKADPERDAIKVDGKRIQHNQQHRYLLLNKPKAYMSTVEDPEGRKTVMDLVPAAMRKALVPVGRLDYHTEGLLLLTDDGEFAQRIAHPRYGSTKTYEVKVKGAPTEAQLDRLREGILLDGHRTSPAKITSRGPRKPTGTHRRGEPESDNSWWIVEISEGRTRQVREMFFRIGHPVQKLRRVAIGPLRDARLPVGALRELTEQEVEKLLRSARQPEAKPARKTPPARKKAAAATNAAAKQPAAEKPAPRARKPVSKPARKPPTGVKRAGARKPGARKQPQGRR
ncbi:MAG TPA: pseudouridine synthase [Thermoanaerobaculia bacterium]|nr:pseudouridine synthase [Thermoanaerobaculia bacterium]